MQQPNVDIYSMLLCLHHLRKALDPTCLHVFPHNFMINHRNVTNDYNFSNNNADFFSNVNLK